MAFAKNNISTFSWRSDQLWMPAMFDCEIWLNLLNALINWLHVCLLACCFSQPEIATALSQRGFITRIALFLCCLIWCEPRVYHISLNLHKSAINKQICFFLGFFLKYRKFQHFCVDSAHQSGLIALRIRDHGLVLIRLLSHTLLSTRAGFHDKPSLELLTLAQTMPTSPIFLTAGFYILATLQCKLNIQKCSHRI